MDYLDFHLKIGAPVAEGQYPVSSRSPTSGETNGVFARPLTDEQLELFVLKVGLARRGVRRIHSPEWRAAQDFGQKLFRALFTDEIRAAYVASHNDAVRQGKGLRIHLTLDAPELANYPWEFLYDPAGNQFLSLFEDTPILRYIELSRPVMPLTVAPPLRILAIASSPKDYEPLDLARERRNLSKALDPLIQAGLFELDWLPTATLEAVREQLLKRPYHIFHFIGHGGFDERQQDGVLLFENAAQYSNRVSGERLAVILGNHRTLRLAVLNACEGARTSEQDPFAGTAMTLVRTGNLPAVIAMQFEITDNAAINFASGFYAAIAAGRPVDAAVSQGRQAIFANDNDVEWSTPVLYLRASDGMIFNINTATADRETERIAQEQKRLAQAIAEIDRAAAQAEIDRSEKARLEQERLAQEQAEQERLAAEQAEQARLAREQSEARRAAAALVEQERIAVEQAEQERLAREKLEAERLAAEQVERERLAREELETERAAAEKAELERVAAEKAEQERLAREKLEAERAASEKAEQERVAAEKAEQERVAADQAEQKRRQEEALLEKRLAEEKRQAERNAAERLELERREKERRAEEAQAREADDVQAKIIVGDVKPAPEFRPPPAFSPERTSPLPSSKPKVKAVSEARPASDESPPQGIVTGSVGKPLVLAVLLLTLTPALGTTGSYARSISVDDQPLLAVVALLFMAGALIMGVMGVWVLGKSLQRVTPFDSPSVILLEAGWVIGFMAAIFVPDDAFGPYGKTAMISVIIGASTAFALKVGNPKLNNTVLVMIAAAWVIGFVVPAVIASPFYEAATSDIWEWLHPLKDQVGWNPVVVVQFGITSLLFGWISPLFSTVSTYLLARNAAAKLTNTG